MLTWSLIGFIVLQVSFLTSEFKYMRLHLHFFLQAEVIKLNFHKYDNSMCPICEMVTK